MSSKQLETPRKKGGYRYRWWKVNDLEHNEGYNELQLRALLEHFHDPDFWKALATARKWEDVNGWRFHWHRFIDHLADGKMLRVFSPLCEKQMPPGRLGVASDDQGKFRTIQVCFKDLDPTLR